MTDLKTVLMEFNEWFLHESGEDDVFVLVDEPERIIDKFLSEKYRTEDQE